VEVVSEQHETTTYLANVGTNILEFAYLTEATGDKRYARAAQSVLDRILKISEDQALAPMDLDPYAARFATQHVTVGPMGDSYFEYLLKRYLQGGCKEHDLLVTWKTAMEEMRKGLLSRSQVGDLTWIASWAERDNPPSDNINPQSIGMDHLACYVGGMLALASHFVPEEEVEDWWLPTGIEVTRTCYEMYQLSPSGLAPDSVVFDDNGMQTADASFRLRPETLESLFYLFRVTGNITYREMSWKIFQSIDDNLKTEYGYAMAADVMETPLQKEDAEATWMGAETLKYALLTQMPPEKLPLDKFTFNTEAHPLPAASGCVRNSRA